jgi:hypothetical protein
MEEGTNDLTTMNSMQSVVLIHVYTSGLINE